MTFIALIIVPLFVGLWAQMKVKSAYSKYVQVPSRGRITGREAAEAVMASAGIHDVEIVECHGTLTDHYDPQHKRLALSRDNFRGSSLAALGVAAHEAGHAIQHKQAYAPLNLRMALVPITTFASQLLPIYFMGTIFLFGGQSSLFIMIGIFAYLVLTVFQLVTLPVEFDASARAKKQLVGLGIVDRDELVGVNKTLDAAAYTYVAAFISSLGWLLYLLASRR